MAGIGFLTMSRNPDQTTGTNIGLRTPSSARCEAMCCTRCRASRDTPEKRPDPQVCSQGKPMKLNPGTVVSPRWCSGLPRASNTGACSQPKSGRKPMHQTMAEMTDDPNCSRVRSASG